MVSEGPGKMSDVIDESATEVMGNSTVAACVSLLPAVWAAAVNFP